MGNSAGLKATFCCKGKRGLESILNGSDDASDDNEDGEGNGGGAISYFEYTADQSEVDVERGVVTLVSALKTPSQLQQYDKAFLVAQ